MTNFSNFSNITFNITTPSPSFTNDTNITTPSPSFTNDTNITAPSPIILVPSPIILVPSPIIFAPSPIIFAPSPVGPNEPDLIVDNGTLVPLIAACLFVITMIIATVFRSKTKKFWDSYSARHYHIVDEGEESDILTGIELKDGSQEGFQASVGEMEV